MGNKRGLILLVVTSVMTMMLTAWDIRNSITIGKMGMAWDTGAPVWPYQTPDILLRLINLPAYLIGVPLANLLGLTAPEHRLVVLPIAIGFWVLLAAAVHVRRKGHPNERLWRWCLVPITLLSLCCATAVFWGAYRWWSIYGHSAAFSWLVLLRLTTPAVWCLAAAFVSSLRMFSPNPTQ